MRAWAWRTIIIVCWLVAWQAIAQILLDIKPTNRFSVATPLQVGEALWGFITGTAPGPVADANSQLLLTLYQIGLAFVIAAFVGLGSGMLIGSFKFIGETLEPIIITLLAVPNFVLLPIFWLVFGLGTPTAVAFGALLGFFPSIANTVAGTRQVEIQFFTLSTSMGATTLQTFMKVVIPGSAGPIISGLKQGFSLAVIGVVGSQIILPTSGLGKVIDDAQGYFFTPEMYAVILIAIMIAVMRNIIFSYVERRIV